MKIFRMLKQDDGVAAVEFAIILPLFITLIFGIIEFSLIMYNKAMITNASREGARYGILYFDPVKTQADLRTAIELKVKSYLQNVSQNSKLISFGNSSGPELIPEPKISKDVSGDFFIEVAVRYPYDFLLVPNFVPGLPQTLTLSSTTSMRMENQNQTLTPSP